MQKKGRTAENHGEKYIYRVLFIKHLGYTE